MKRIVLSCLCVVGFASVAMAQPSATICDQPAQVNPTVPGPTVVVGFCWSQKGTDNVPTTLTSMALQMDGVVKATTSGLPALAGPSASGLYYYEFAGVPVTSGAHTVSITLTNANGSTASAPFGFAVAPQASGAPPAAPAVLLAR